MALGYVISVILVTCLVPEVTSQVLSRTADVGVQEIVVPMCKGLVPYNLTKLPNSFNHTTQVEVHRIIEHMWWIMDVGCSRNFRLLVCSLYLPPYDIATNTTLLPCKQTCMKAKKKCKSLVNRSEQQWPSHLRCNTLPRGGRRSRSTCLRPYSERRRDNFLPYTFCQNNPLPVCEGLPAALSAGSLPNRFLQRNITQIEVEMDYYTTLLESGCNRKLAFFLCGTYMPFCLQDTSFASPCGEVCDEIKRDCEPVHQLAYQGLPWPNKLQCHRFTRKTSEVPCVDPADYE